MSGDGPDLNSARLAPRFMDIPTFMRAPLITDTSEFDIALIGVPYDGAVTNRAGARHGPREVRSASSMIREIHPVTRVNPFEKCRVGDAGDVPFKSLYDIEAAHADIEAFIDWKVREELKVAAMVAGRKHLTKHQKLTGKHGTTALLYHYPLPGSAQSMLWYRRCC